jgi:peptidoglycan/xylan/chitin deacetylase (PgdA/CDA1 family)
MPALLTLLQLYLIQMSKSVALFLIAIRLVITPSLSQDQVKKKSVKKIKPVKEVWIDKFDSTTGKALTGSTWYALSDRVNGGASDIIPSDIRQAYVSVSEKYSNQVIKFNYQIRKKNFAWPYVTFGLPLTNDQLIGDITFWKGIAYDFKGKGHTFSFQISEVKDWAHYQKKIEDSETWTTVVIPFAELAQPSWGKPVLFDASLIQGLAWAIHGKDGDRGEIYIDNIRFLKRLPAPEQLAAMITVSSEDTASEKVSVFNETEPLIQQDPPHSKKELPAKIKVADWYGFSKAAYSFTFDDGLISQYQYAAPVLNKYNMKATFYILSESLQEDSAKLPSWRYGYWHHFLKLHQQGHEIGAHTVTHPRLTSLSDGNVAKPGTLIYELVAPIKTIKEKISGSEVISFAYPMVDYNDHVMDQASRYFVSSRAGGNLTNSKVPEWNELKSYTIRYTEPRILENDTKKIIELEKWINDNTIHKQGWSILMAHDVLPVQEAGKATDSWHPISVETFESFVKWIKERQDRNELWVETVGNISKYVKEREFLDIKILEDSENKMMLELSDNLPDEIYNYPLSIEVSVPVSWKKVSVKQMDKIQSVEVKEGKIFLNAIPDRGKIEILKGE